MGHQACVCVWPRMGLMWYTAVSLRKNLKIAILTKNAISRSVLTGFVFLNQISDFSSILLCENAKKTVRRHAAYRRTGQHRQHKAAADCHHVCCLPSFLL